MKKYLSYLITIVIAFILYYLLLPPINLHSAGFYFYIIIVLVIFMLNYSLFSITNNSNEIMELLFNKRKIKTIGGVSDKVYKICLGIIATIIIGGFIVNFICSPIFNAKSYHNRIKVDETGDFVKDVK